jgi:hypothetical protein
MAYENSAGIGVSNQYGPRGTGGERGVFKTEGYLYEYVIDLSQSAIDFPFVSYPGGVAVFEVDVTFATGTLTSLEIGGVEVVGATSTVPVVLAADNTGVIEQTGATGGKIIVRFKNVAGADA